MFKNTKLLSWNLVMKVKVEYFGQTMLTSVLVKMKLNIRTTIEVFDVIKSPCRNIVSPKVHIHWLPRVGTNCCRGQWCKYQTHSPQRRTHFVCISLWNLMANKRLYISIAPTPITHPSSSLFPSTFYLFKCLI